VKLKNFKLTGRTGIGSYEMYYATVDVYTWCGLAMETKIIAKKLGGGWYFADSGKWTPDYQAEELQRVYEISHGGISKVSLNEKPQSKENIE